MDMDIPQVRWWGTAEGGEKKVAMVVQQVVGAVEGRTGGRGNLLPNYFNSIHFAIGPVLASSVVRFYVCVRVCLCVCLSVCVCSV